MVDDYRVFISDLEDTVKQNDEVIMRMKFDGVIPSHVREQIGDL